MSHSIGSLTNAALAIVGQIWTAARDRTMPWNAHLILDQYVCDVLEVQQNRPQEEPSHGEGVCYLCHSKAYLVDGVCDECWQLEAKQEEYLNQQDHIREEAYQRRLVELDEDPRFADPFARPDWNGDPNEY